MINSMASCALCILALLVNAVCASSGVFHNPPAAGPERDYSANPIYYVGDTISANWSTSIVNTSLFITQERTANIIPLFLALNDTSSYDWIVSLHAGSATFNLTGNSTTPGSVFYFGVANAGGGSGSFISHYFNISADPRPSTENNETTSSSPSSSSPDNSTTGTDAPTSTVTVLSSPLSSPSSGLSVGAQAGIGVAVGLIGLSLLGAFAWLLLKKRRENNGRGVKPQISEPKRLELESPSSGTGAGGVGGGMGKVYAARMAELNGESQFEMPAQEWRAQLPGEKSPNLGQGNANGKRSKGVSVGQRGRGWLGDGFSGAV